MRPSLRILLTIFFTMAGVSQAKHMDEDSIDKRTRPVGQVHIEGMPKVVESTQPVVEEVKTTVENTPEEPAQAVAVSTTTGRTGEELYNTFCIACHSTGLANAPKTGDAAAWGKLLEPGIDQLISSAKKGKNVMPPMGTCIDCSDEELKSAILFMSDAQ